LEKKQGDMMNGKTEEQTQVHGMKEDRRKGIRNAKVEKEQGNRCEIFTAVSTNTILFRDVTPCSI
jgi:hypothetical protein